MQNNFESDSQPAGAAVFTLTGSGSVFSFEIPDTPVPEVYFQGVRFVIYDVPAPSASGLVDVTFYNKDWYAEDMRSLQIKDYYAEVSLFELFGPQLYSGSESEPLFTPGSYQLMTEGGTPYSLTITTGAAAVPEPAAWALMIAGLGTVGGVMRSRRRTRIRYT